MNTYVVTVVAAIAAAAITLGLFQDIALIARHETNGAVQVAHAVSAPQPAPLRAVNAAA